MLIIKDWKGLIAAGISPEQDMVIKHFYYFGPVSSNLCKRIRDEDWRAAWAADVEVTERPEARMRFWIKGEGLGEHTVNFVGKKEPTWIPNAVPRWSRFLFTRFGNGV